jgi:SHS2 domain-containing protein
MKISNLDHTADAGVEIVAATLEELFLGAAEGMYSVMNCRCEGNRSGHKSLHLKEGRLDTLLVTFLNELNYYISTHYQMLEPIKNLIIRSENDAYFLSCKAGVKPIGQEALQDLVEI